jgi:hypothetical protein
VFFGCVLWAFARPPARAAHELLTLCALLTLAVPLAHWWSTGLNPLLALLQGDGVVVGVALVSYCLRAVLAHGARCTARGQHGDPHSVWSCVCTASHTGTAGCLATHAACHAVIIRSIFPETGTDI